MKTLNADEADRLRFELAQINVQDAEYTGTCKGELINVLVDRGLLIIRNVVYLLPNPDDAGWMDEWSYSRPFVTELGKLALIAYQSVTR
jgi:hypothetical protein